MMKTTAIDHKTKWYPAGGLDLRLLGMFVTGTVDGESGRDSAILDTAAGESRNRTQ